MPGLRVALICAAIAAMSLTAVVVHPLAKVGLFAAPSRRWCLPSGSIAARAAPLLPSDAFSLRSATGIGLWLALLVSIAYSPLQIFVPIFLQVLHGLDPLGAGYMVAGASFGWTGDFPPGRRRVAAAATDRLLVAGPAMMAAGLLGVALLMPLEPALIVFPAIALTGAGIGSCWAFIAQRVMTGARKGEEDLAASSVATVQQTGFALGAALAGLVANAAGLSGGLDRADVAAAAFWVPASFVVAALAATIMGSRLARHRSAMRLTAAIDRPRLTGFAGGHCRSRGAPSATSGFFQHSRFDRVTTGWRRSVRPMSLAFPNESRFYDGAVHAVRFPGYDGAMEAPFFVGEGALKRIQPNMPSDEAGLLNAFDRNRERIYAAAVQGL